MKAYKINGLWCLATDKGTFLTSLIGQEQPSDKDEAMKKLLLRLNGKKS